MELNVKQLARSKHQHSYIKDKKYKSKKDNGKGRAPTHQQASNERSSDGSDEETNEPEVSFHRRKVISNQYRYSNAEEEEKEVELRDGRPRDRNRDILLGLHTYEEEESADISEFRFFEEKEWDDIEANKIQTEGEIIIDYKRVAAKLQELSLHERLILDLSFFPANLHPNKEKVSVTKEEKRILSFDFDWLQNFSKEMENEQKSQKDELLTLDEIFNLPIKMESKKSGSKTQKQASEKPTTSNTEVAPNDHPKKEAQPIIEQPIVEKEEKPPQTKEVKVLPKEDTTKKEKENKPEKVQDLEDWLDSII